MTQLIKIWGDDGLACETAALVVTQQFGEDMLGVAPELKGALVVFNWRGKLNEAAMSHQYRVRDNEPISLEDVANLIGQLQVVEASLVTLMYEHAKASTNQSLELMKRLLPVPVTEAAAEKLDADSPLEKTTETTVNAESKPAEEADEPFAADPTFSTAVPAVDPIATVPVAEKPAATA